MKTVFAGVFAVCLLATGCANTYQVNHVASGKREMDRPPVVAVMPFSGVSESPGSGLIVADIMANELYALGGFVVVTPEVVAARAAPKEGEVLSPEETGRMIGASYIITGRVTEYTYKSGVGEQPAVGVTARLIESETGRVLWSASRARTGSAAWFQEDSLALLTSRICNDLAKSLHGDSRKYGWGSPDTEYDMNAYPVIKTVNPPKTPAPVATPPAVSVREPDIDIPDVSAASPADFGGEVMEWDEDYAQSEASAPEALYVPELLLGENEEVSSAGYSGNLGEPWAYAF